MDGFSGDECQVADRCGGTVDCGVHGSCVSTPIEGEACLLDDDVELTDVTMSSSSDFSVELNAASGVLTSSSSWSAQENNDEQYLQVSVITTRALFSFSASQTLEMVLIICFS